MGLAVSLACVAYAPVDAEPSAPAVLSGGMPECAVGSYEFSDGRTIDIGLADEGRLRWRRTDGTSGALSPREDGSWQSSIGWTDRADGIVVRIDCDDRAVVFDGDRGEQLALPTVETSFGVEGATLAGRLILPLGDQPVPIVILVHGAERTSALDHYALQRQFPAAGIGAFVYDKRGTGQSTGRYTHDYLTLATDVIAAVREARRLAGPRAGRIGLQAGSQGGWVAPLAVQIEPLSFVIVSFGLAVSPMAAERELLADDLRRRGYGEDAVAEVMQIADAVEELLASNFNTGYQELTAARMRLKDRPWYDAVHGSVTELVLNTPEEELRRIGPSIAPNVPVDYDPMPVLRNLDVPQLWVLAGEDRAAPPGETSRRLGALVTDGRPIIAMRFDRTEHGMYEFETAPDGTRTSTRAPAGYFAMMRDFILAGTIESGYGATKVASTYPSSVPAMEEGSGSNR